MHSHLTFAGYNKETSFKKHKCPELLVVYLIQVFMDSSNDGYVFFGCQGIDIKEMLAGASLMDEATRCTEASPNYSLSITNLIVY